jgi:hypothetical protein
MSEQRADHTLLLLLQAPCSLNPNGQGCNGGDESSHTLYARCLTCIASIGEDNRTDNIAKHKLQQRCEVSAHRQRLDAKPVKFRALED